MRPNHVVGRNSPPYRVLVPARPSGAGLHRAAHQPPATGMPVGGARLALSLSVLVAIPLLALNLRPAVTSVGAVLADIRADSGMSAVLASIVVAAPVWCFAVGGGLAYKLRASWGTSRTVTLALVMLAATLATRVVAGPILLLAGTVLACLSIAVLGTLLPVITHAAPTKAWALLTGCYVAAMGGGSGLGALITPQVSGGSTWQWGVSAWALLAAAALVAWRVATRRFTEPPVAAGPRPSPFNLRPPSTAWSTTIHFGLTSGFTFTIMGWLPSILLDHSHVNAATVGWMFSVAMALGVPIALMVPKWARASQSQSALAVVLCAPNLVAMGGLLLYPEITPWVWAVGLGLGMPAVGLALTLISLRAAPDGDTAAALSSMVQGFGYAIAGATALGAGLLHSSTQAWEWPLIALLVILCGQLITGMHAGLPTTVYSGRRFAPSVERPEPRRVPPPRPASGPKPGTWQLPVPGNGSEPRPFPKGSVPWQVPMSAPGIGWGPRGASPPGAVPFQAVRGSGPRPFPSPKPVTEPESESVTQVVKVPVQVRGLEKPAEESLAEPAATEALVAEPAESSAAEAEPVAQSDAVVAEPVAEAEELVVEPVAEAEELVAEPVTRAEALVAEPVAEASVAEPAAVVESAGQEAALVAEPVEAVESGAQAEALVAEPVESFAPKAEVAESVGQAEALVAEPVGAVEPHPQVETAVAEPVARVEQPVTEPVARIEAADAEPVAQADEPVTATEPVAQTEATVTEPVEATLTTEPVDARNSPTIAQVLEVPEQSTHVDGPGREAELEPHVAESHQPAGSTRAESEPARDDDDRGRLMAPRQEALFDVPQQEALFEIPLPRLPTF
jgi:MFS transporter, CP family, cyanate transporter